MTEMPVQTLRTVDASRREVTLENGSRMPMFGLTLTVFDGSADRIAQLPTIWMSPEAAEALAHAVRVGLQREFPERTNEAHSSEAGPAMQ